MTGLGTLVADLAGGAQRPTVGSGTIARDVAQLAAGVALHGLSLAITGEVVGATALVAGRGTRVAVVEATAVALETAARASRAASAGGSRVGAVALMTTSQFLGRGLKL